MGVLKKISDRGYITNLFSNLKQQKEVPVFINYRGNQILGRLMFTGRKRNEPTVRLDKNSYMFSIGEQIEITFFNREVIFLFQSIVTDAEDNIYKLERPSMIFSSFRRQMSRYNIKENEKVTLSFQGRIKEYQVTDLSTRGLAFLCEEDFLEDGSLIRNIRLRIENEYEVYFDAVVKYCKSCGYGRYSYGISFSNLELEAQINLFLYIFDKIHPNLKFMKDFSTDDIYRLYERSGVLSKNINQEIHDIYRTNIRKLKKLSESPLVSSSIAYYKNNTPITLGSIVRVYDRTFMGHQVISLPEARLSPKANTAVYMGLADFMLNHKYFEYYIKYITDDLPWHQEMFMNISEIVNDRQRFVFDIVQMYKCQTDECFFVNENSSYSCQLADDAGEFADFCETSLSPLVANCYSYNEKEFELNEIKQVYSVLGFYAARSLWHVSRNGNILAYAVSEVYTDRIMLDNIADSCWIHFTQPGIDILKVLKALLPEVSAFYRKYGRSKFNVMFKSWVQVAQNITLPGLEYKSSIGRVMMDREGMSQYKKLLMENFISYTKYFPLTHPQLAIWYTEKVYPGTSFGNIVGTARLKDAIRPELLEAAINLAIEKNDGLRLRVVELDNKVQQYVSRYKRIKVDFFDFSRLGGLEGFYKWDEYSTSSPFNLIDSDLFYFAVFKISDNDGGFYIKTHHLISDAWTQSGLISKIVEYYYKLKDGIRISRQKKPSYIDFITGEEEYINSSRFKLNKKFWELKYNSIPELTSLKPETHKSRGTKAERKTFVLSKDITAKIHKYCNDSQISPFTFFLGVFSIYLYRVTSKQDIVIGTPILNRSNTKEKETAGMFVSMIPVRIQVNPQMKLTEFIDELSKEWLVYLKNQKYPYDLILKEFREKHKVTDNLFDMAFSYQNAKIQKDDLTGDYTVRWHFSGSQTDSLEIHVNDRDDDGEYVINMDYLTDVFNRREIETLFEHYLNLISDAVENTGKKLFQLEMLSKDERNKILYEYNNTSTQYPKEKTIHELFEEQVERTPDSIAVVFGETQLTYRELNHEANNLAVTLRNKGVSQDKAVAILVDRSIEMVIGVIGILKAGGAYLPIDIKYPNTRIEYILCDSGADILLTKRDLNMGFDFKGEVLYIDGGSVNEQEMTDFEDTSSPGSLAYIMYTSGSTGNPKGTMVEHINVVRLVKNTNFIEFSEDDRILQTGAVVFDASTFEIWGALLNGLRLYLVDDGTILDVEKLGQALKDNKITILWLTSPLFNQLSQNKPEMFLPLRYLLVGGDVLSPQHINKVRNKCPGIKIINGYGPTENTTFSTCFHIDKTYDGSIPIGSPIANSTAYILDKYNNLMPVGHCGELCVGGDGVARGYLNREQLTAEKFISDPFNPNGRMYRTGDLARWLEDGNIDFIGRIDNQVKIRGFRIELGEIELRIKECIGVKDTVVTVKEDEKKNKFLCAYIVMDENGSIDGIREYLRMKLPPYMIPSYFLRIESFILNANGKVDKQKLPEIQDNIEDKGMIVAPRNQFEVEMANIWKSSLNVEQISIDDSFFDLGGDSLKAINLLNMIQKDLNLRINISELFEAQSIRALSAKFDFNTGIKFEEIRPIKKKDYYSVSSSQKRMYLLSKIDDSNINYNVPGKITITGKLDSSRLISVLNDLAIRHEAFRTSFHFINNDVVQRINEKVALNVKYIEAIEEKEFEKIENDFVRPFDLSMAPLFRAELVKINDDKSVLLFDMHHIICDGISVNIFIKELIALYEGKNLPELKIQYKDYCEWQNDLIDNPAVKKQEAYWRSVFSNEIPVLNMPTSFGRPPVQSFEGDRISFIAGKELTQKLSRIAQRNNTTLFMLLLAAYNVILAKYTTQDDIIVGTPIAGRTTPHANDIIGVFVNTLALRNYPKATQRFKDFLEQVKKSAIDAYENQDYPFDELVNKINIQRDISRNPIFDTMFVMQSDYLPVISSEGMVYATGELESRVCKFDLTLQAYEADGAINFDLDFCTKLFSKDFVKDFSTHFLNILESITQNENKSIAQLEMLSEDEKNRLFTEFNNTEADYPGNKSLYELFEMQVQKTPNNIAVVFKETKLTYDRLNREANKVAWHLKEKGIKEGSIVGVMLERSLELIVGIFGIIKACAVYVPVDPNYPEDRINHILMNSGAEMLLTQSKFASKGITESEIVIEEIEKIMLRKDLPEENLNLKYDPEQLLYLLYTSGSTGVPKGAMIKSHAFVNLINWFNSEFDINEKDNALLIAPISFDLAQKNLYSTLVKGGTLSLYLPGFFNYEMMSEIIESNNITFINCAPSVFYPLVECNEGTDFTKLKSLRYVFFGGEAINANKLTSWTKSVNCNAEIVNTYGPTECTDIASFYRAKGKDIKPGMVIPIGKPINNFKIYVLDENLNPLPVGVPGELCIGGIGLARGYHNDLQMTEKKFVDWALMDNTKIYKTGDLVKWLPDGDLEYIGRNDNQVKIRGLRIELGEIEACILKHPKVKEAVVIAQEDKSGSKYLVAYVVGESDIDCIELRESLFNDLPDYMIPSYFIQLDKMPLSPNGKIDKKVLPKPVKKATERQLPQSETEKILAAAWEEVLKIKNIGVGDSFFELGGDSLGLMRVLSIIFKHGWDLTIQDFYRYQTIKELAERIDQTVKKVYDSSKVEFGLPVKHEDVISVYEKKPLGNVLLTGATGYLGSHLVREILEDKGAKVYCLVRSSREVSGEKRLRDILDFYFGDEVVAEIGERVFAVEGDICLENMGMPKEKYLELAEVIETVFHSAGMVKHYGEYEEFETVNVSGTAEVIKFAEKSKSKLNYISTTSVSADFLEQKTEGLVLTENDFYIGQNYSGNPYIRSKFEAENIVLKAINSGLPGTVFRVGNLSERYKDGKFQKNISENMVHFIIKAIIKFEAVPDKILEQCFDFSPVDYCSKFLVSLSKLGKSNGVIYHLFNSNPVSLRKILIEALEKLDIHLKILNGYSFRDYIEYISKFEGNEDLKGILINDFDFEKMIDKRFRIKIDSDITEKYLSALGLEWPEISTKYLSDVVKNIL